MITDGDLRILSRTLIRLLTRRNKVQLDDIRYAKNNEGMFPRKIVRTDKDGKVYRESPSQLFADLYELDAINKSNTVELKETPYQRTDLFIIFDNQTMPNIISEVIDGELNTVMPFNLIINIYGDESADELQYMLSKMYNYKVTDWLRINKMSILREPNEWQILDGRENNIWWKRRRVVFELNIHQRFDTEEDDKELDIENIVSNLEVIGGK